MVQASPAAGAQHRRASRCPVPGTRGSAWQLGRPACGPVPIAGSWPSGLTAPIPIPGAGMHKNPRAIAVATPRSYFPTTFSLPWVTQLQLIPLARPGLYLGHGTAHRRRSRAGSRGSGGGWGVPEAALREGDRGQGAGMGTGCGPPRSTRAPAKRWRSPTYLSAQTLTSMAPLCLPWGSPPQVLLPLVPVTPPPRRMATASSLPRGHGMGPRSRPGQRWPRDPGAQPRAFTSLPAPCLGGAVPQRRWHRWAPSAAHLIVQQCAPRGAAGSPTLPKAHSRFPLPVVPSSAPILRAARTLVLLRTSPTKVETSREPGMEVRGRSSL